VDLVLACCCPAAAAGALQDSDWRKPSHKLKTAVWVGLAYLLVADPGRHFHDGPLLFGVSWPATLTVVVFYQIDYALDTSERPISWSSMLDTALFKVTTVHAH
jgi:hypothetical protein